MRQKIEKIITKSFRSFDITKEVAEIENLYKKQSDLLVKHTIELSEALKEIKRLKGKTNYDEVEVLKQQIKAKDEMLEKMSELLSKSYSDIKNHNAIKELLTQYKQGK